MQKRFGVPIGLSDHTLDNATAIASVALGACIIEKHVTMNRNGGGPDDSFSLEPKELELLCMNSKTAWQSLGRIDYGQKTCELENIKFRRSLYFVKNIKAGEAITAEHIKSIRPGYGLAPKYLDHVIGRIVKCDVLRGSPVTLELVKI
jgi:sialic acid synthase SpsE